MATLVFPEPPSSNRYWRVKGRAYKSAQAREYQAQISDLLRHYEPLDGPIDITVRWYRSRRAGDLDNRLKVIMDALQGALYLDDHQVVRIVAERYDDKARPRLEVQVRPWSPPRSVQDV